MSIAHVYTVAFEGTKVAAAHPKCAQDYQGRISGPLLDRIDIHVEVKSNALG